MDFTQTSEFDGLVKSRKSDGKVKSSSSRRRESRVMRRTYRTSKAQRDEAQRRNWTFYEAIRVSPGIRQEAPWHLDLFAVSMVPRGKREG